MFTMLGVLGLVVRTLLLTYRYLPLNPWTCRVSFKGGNNVTLRGSTDPDWGWVDGHGQAVSRSYT